MAHLDIPNFLDSNIDLLFFFSFVGRGREIGVMSFIVLVFKEARTGCLTAYECFRLDLEPLYLLDVFYFLSL